MTMKDELQALKARQTTDRDDLDQLRSILEGVMGKIDQLLEKHAELDVRMESMEVAKPAELRALTAEAIAEAIKADPYTRFEVLADWKGQMRKGSVVRADHVPHIADYVAAGLQLGAPQDQAKVIARLRAETEARAELAAREADVARAAAARLDAQAAEARMVADQTRGEPIDEDIAALAASGG
jgi:hypothetical protein